MQTRGIVLTFGLVLAALAFPAPAQARVAHLHKAEAISTVAWVAPAIVPGDATVADCRRVRANVRRCSFVGEDYAVRIRETRRGYLIHPVGVPALDIR